MYLYAVVVNLRAIFGPSVSGVLSALGWSNDRWNMRDHLEAVAHGDEPKVESALGELCQVADISRTPINGLGCKLT